MKLCENCVWLPVLRCAPASGKNRSPVYLLWRAPDCQSCDEVDTQRSGANGSTHIDLSEISSAAVVEWRWIEHTSFGIEGLGGKTVAIPQAKYQLLPMLCDDLVCGVYSVSVLTVPC